MIDIMLQQINAINESLRNVQKAHYESKIQQLKAKIRMLESRVEYQKQLLIFEERKNAEYRGTLQ